MHGPWSYCHKASAFEFHIVFYPLHIYPNFQLIEIEFLSFEKKNVFIYYIKHKRPCLTTFLNTENSVENMTVGEYFGELRDV